MRIGPNTPPTPRQLIPPVEPVNTDMKVREKLIRELLSYQATAPNLTRSGSLVQEGKPSSEDMVMSDKGYKVKRCSLAAPEEAELDQNTRLLKYEEHRFRSMIGQGAQVTTVHYYNPDTGKPVQRESSWHLPSPPGGRVMEMQIFALDHEKEITAIRQSGTDPITTLKYDGRIGQLNLAVRNFNPTTSRYEFDLNQCRAYGKPHPTNLGQFKNLALLRFNELLNKIGPIGRR